MRSVAVAPSDQHADMLVAILERLGRLERGVSGVRPGKVPAVRARHTATQNVTTGVDTAVVWAGTETYDTDGFHDTVTNSSRLTVPAGLTGLYVVTFSLWHPAGTGTSAAWVTLNGAGVWAPAAAVLTASGLRLNGVDLVPLAAGDYVEVVTSQSSGGTLAVGSTIDHFAVTRHGAWL